MTTIPDPVFPSDSDVVRAVQAIHDRPEQIVLVVTGGATGVQQMLWDTPGASRTLLDAQMPYGTAAFDRFVGHSAPDRRYCNADAALLLAHTAWARAREMALTSTPVLGVGATMALVTDREKKGPCRIFIAVVGGDGVRKQTSMELTPDQSKSWTRKVQGKLSDFLVLNCLLEALGLRPLRISFAKSGTSVISYLEPWTVIQSDGNELPVSAISPTTHVLYPGSFNPRHHGHDAIMNTVRSQLCMDVICLIERGHPDKGPLPDAEIARRVGQFAWRGSVMVTDGVGYYIEKARRFPGFTFIVGADTMRRICDASYYGSTEALAAVFEEFIALGTSFLVFDRQADDGSTTYMLDSVEMPAAFRDRCRRCEGRWNVSSSQIREGRTTP